MLSGEKVREGARIAHARIAGNSRVPRCATSCWRRWYAKLPPAKLVNRRTGHVSTAQHFISGETQDPDLMRMGMMSRMTKVFQHLQDQAQYHIEEIIKAKHAARGDEYVVRVF